MLLATYQWHARIYKHTSTYTHARIHTDTHTHTPGVIVFPNVIYSTLSALSPNFKTVIIITNIASIICCDHDDLVAENNTANFKAQDARWNVVGVGGSSQPAWDGRHFKDAPAICSMVCEGFMKGRNGRHVNMCQTYLREKCWKNTIFHTAVSRGFERKTWRIRQKMKLKGCI